MKSETTLDRIHPLPMKSVNRFELIVFSAGLLFVFQMSALGQKENPAQTLVQDITGPAVVRTVKANIVPLIWKATIDKSVISVPLRSVEYYGIQHYDVDGAARARELTISTHSQGLIRIYHIEPLGALGDTASSMIDSLRKVAEGGTDTEFDLPVKVFPTTTHSHMVEFRVGQRTAIDKLFESLEGAMIEYHARDLKEELRPEVVREISVSD